MLQARYLKDQLLVASLHLVQMSLPLVLGEYDVLQVFR
jgi:hypothetical protein